MWRLITSPFAGPVGAGLSLLLAVALAVVSLQHQATRLDRDRLSVAIYNKKDGYVVQLDRCDRNGRALEASIEAQNKRFDDLSKDSTTRLAAAEAALARARTATDKANGQIAVLMSRPPVGIDTCARVLDIDARVKEMLEQ